MKLVQCLKSARDQIAFAFPSAHVFTLCSSATTTTLVFTLELTLKLQPVGRIVHAVVVVVDVASPIQNSDYVARRQLKMMNVSRVSIYVYAAHGQ